MCGLAGIAGNTNIRLRDGFKDLLDVTKLRGRDSTGVFTVRGAESVAYAKVLGTPEGLYDTGAFDAAMTGVPKIMAGHCRSKTVGENNRSNAHPYDFDNLIGMHNGTLRSYHNMEGYDYKRTDSHALYHNIDRYGVEEVIPKLDDDGAWALAWWDKNEQRLNFLRNDKRPLWFAWTKDRTSMIWASEPWMFNTVARHEDLWDGKSLKEGEADSPPYFQLPPDTLWSFSVASSVKPGEKYLTFHQPRALKAEGKKPVGFTGGSPKPPHYPHGGKVTDPFTAGKDAVKTTYEKLLERVNTKKAKELDDGLEGIGDTSPAESTITTPSVDKSKKISSNVLDFRQALKRGTSFGKSTLSLHQKTLPGSLPSSSEGGTGSSAKSCETEEALLRCKFPQVSLRDISGVTYITHNTSGSEITQEEFESRTGGKCIFCHTPIGDLSEVAAFTDKAMSAFLCNSCLVEPKLAVTG